MREPDTALAIILKQTAVAENLPYKLVKKWWAVTDMIKVTTEEMGGFEYRQNNSLLSHKQFDLYGDMVDKSRINIVVVQGHIEVLRILIQNTRNDYLVKVSAIVNMVMGVSPKPGKALMIKSQN